MILFIGFALMLNPEIVEQSFVFHATVAVLKRMNLLKANVEIENIFQFVPLITIVGTEYRLHLSNPLPDSCTQGTHARR